MHHDLTRVAHLTPNPNYIQQQTTKAH